MTAEEVDAFVKDLPMLEVRALRRACEERIMTEENSLELTSDEREMLARGDKIGAVKSARHRLNVGLREALTFVERRR